MSLFSSSNTFNQIHAHTKSNMVRLIMDKRIKSYFLLSHSMFNQRSYLLNQNHTLYRKGSRNTPSIENDRYGLLIFFWDNHGIGINLHTPQLMPQDTLSIQQG